MGVSCTTNLRNGPVHYIACPIYGKPHVITQIHKSNFLGPMRLIGSNNTETNEIFWCFGHELGTILYLFKF